MSVKIYRQGGLIFAEESGKDLRFFTPESSDLWTSGNQVGITDSISKDTDVFGNYDQIIKIVEGSEVLAESLSDAVSYISSLFPIVNRESNGAIPVNVQDQSTPVIILPMANESARTTLSIQAVVDAETFTVVDGTGFNIGDHFRLVDADSDKFYYATILNVNSNVITVDTPIDFAYSVGSQAISANINMAVDGSVTPVIFKHRLGIPSTPSDTDITRVILTCTTTGGIDLGGFGDGPALTKGLVLRQTGETRVNIFNVKTNADVSNIAYDFNIYDTTNPAQGLDGFVSRLTFAGQNKIGVALRIGQDDNLEVIIQDDLTGLQTLSLIAEGHVVLD